MPADWTENGIFICYRRQDAACIAGRLRDYLNDAFPNQIFIDVEDIRPGRDWLQQIRDGIARSRVVIMLVGPHWHKGSGNQGQQSQEEEDYVATELRLAVEQEKPIIPVLIDGVEMPGPADLPSDLTSLYLIEALEIRSLRFRQDVERLLDVLYPELGVQPPTLLERLFLGPHQRVSERDRIGYARIGLAAATTSLIGAFFPQTQLVSLGLAGIAFMLSMIGMHARGWRMKSYLAMVISGAAVPIAWVTYAVRSGIAPVFVAGGAAAFLVALMIAIVTLVWFVRAMGRLDRRDRRR